MKRIYNYLWVSTFVLLIACGGGEQSTANQEEAPQTEDNDTTKEEVSIALEESSSKPEDPVAEVDFMLGSWKITEYDSPEITKYLQEASGDEDGDLGFYMEKELYATSYLEFVIDKTYRVFNLGDFGDPEDNGNVFKGAWSISEDFKTLSLTREYEEDWVLEIVELSPERIELTFMQTVFLEGQEDREFPVTMKMVPMGE